MVYLMCTMRISCIRLELNVTFLDCEETLLLPENIDQVTKILTYLPRSCWQGL